METSKLILKASDIFNVSTNQLTQEQINFAKNQIEFTERYFRILIRTKLNRKIKCQ